MKPFMGRRVQAVLSTDGWTAGETATVLDTLSSQVGRICVVSGRDINEVAAPARVARSIGTTGMSHTVVVTAPVLFAHGAISMLARAASPNDRVVTRVLVPDAALMSVSFWSASWLARHGVGLADLPECGLDFDRAMLPHDDPQVRGWVRAVEVGVAPPGAVEGSASRWAALEGLRLVGHHGLAGGRSRLGQVRRSRALAKQRQANSRCDYPVR